MDNNLDSVYPAARVSHISKTGEKTPVNVISTAENITYYNNNSTQVDNGSIPAGTKFINTPISDILDKLLYTYVAPKVIDLNSMDNSDIIDAIRNDIVYYKETGKPVPSFNLNVNFKSGSESIVTCTLITTRTNDGATYEKSVSVQVVPNQTYSVQFEVSRFISDCSFKVNINDTKNTSSSPIIEYRFVDVSYVGYVPDDIFDDKCLNKNIISAYFSNMINNHSSYIKSVIGNQQSIKNIPFDNTEEIGLHPVLLVPAKWGTPTIISDGNGNIINSLYISEEINISINECKVYQYLAVVNKEMYYKDFNLLRHIEYRYEESNNCECDCGCNHYSTGIFKGTPILTGYELLANAPIDNRSAVNTFTELKNMKYKYEGLVTYCKELKQLMVFKDGKWEPVANQIYFLDKTPAASFGSVNDTAFNLETGEIFQKCPGGWVFKGTLNVGASGNCVKSLTIGKITTGNSFNVVNSGTDTDIVLDFEFPAVNGEGKLLVGDEVKEAAFEKVFLRTIKELS